MVCTRSVARQGVVVEAVGDGRIAGQLCPSTQMRSLVCAGEGIRKSGGKAVIKKSTSAQVSVPLPRGPKPDTTLRQSRGVRTLDRSDYQYLADRTPKP